MAEIHEPETNKKQRIVKKKKLEYNNKVPKKNPLIINFAKAAKYPN